MLFGSSLYQLFDFVIYTVCNRQTELTNAKNASLPYLSPQGHAFLVSWMADHCESIRDLCVFL